MVIWNTVHKNVNSHKHDLTPSERSTLEILLCMYLIGLAKTYVHECKYKYTSKEGGLEATNMWQGL